MSEAASLNTPRSAGSRRSISKRASVKESQQNLINDDRVMTYPKITFTLTIDIPCLTNAYIAVKSVVLNETTSLGYTESLSTDSENTIVKYTKEFEVIHYIGVDEKQSVVFDIMDGDNFKIRQGYFYASATIRVRDMQKSISKIPVYRGDDFILGYITMNAFINLEPVSVNLGDDSVTAKFLRADAPTAEKIRQLHPVFSHKITKYEATMKVKHVAPFPLKISKKGVTFFFRICLKDDEKSVVDELKVIYQSELIRKSPFNLKVEGIEFGELEITNNHDVKFDDNTMFVIQIYCGGFYKDIGEIPPECCSYTVVNAKKFLKIFHEKGQTEHVFKRKFQLNPDFNDSDHVTKKRASSNKKKSKKNKTPQDMLNDLLNNVSKIKTPEEMVNEINGNTNKFNIDESDDSDNDSDDDNDEEENNDDYDHDKKRDSTATTNTTKANKKDYGTCGIASFMVTKDFESLDVVPGDDLYEEEVELELERAKAKWIQDMKKPFQDACDVQMNMLKRSIEIIEYGMDGWELSPVFVLDMQCPCFHHLADILLQHPLSAAGNHTKKLTSAQLSTAALTSSATESFRGSRVLDAFKIMYDTILPYTDDGIFRAYAGGGVQAPYPDSQRDYIPPPTSILDPDHHYDDGLGADEDDTKRVAVGYPSYGFPRQIGFPLIQEYLMNHMDEFIVFNRFQKKEEDFVMKKLDKYGYLRQCLDTADPTKSWGGMSYSQNMKYRGFDDAMKGFVEASVIYQPILIHQASRYLECPYEDDMMRNIPRMKSSHFGGVLKPSTRAAKIHKTRFTSCYVDSSINTRDNSKTLWDEIIQQRHLLHRGPAVAYDIDAVELLLNEPAKHDKCINVVLWILSKSPPETCYHKIDRVLHDHVNATERHSILVIMLAAEVRLDIDEENPESLQIIAQPFQKFMKFYETTMSRLVAESQGKPSTSVTFADTSKEAITHPRVKLIHWYTFSEVVARAFVLFDERMIGKTNAMAALTSPTVRIRIANGFLDDIPVPNNTDEPSKSSSITGSSKKEGKKDNFTLPSVAYIGEILRDHFPSDTIERIIGREFVFAKKPKRTSSKPKDSNNKKKLFGMFVRKKNTSMEEPMEEEYEELYDADGKDRILNFAEFSDIKKRFEEEYQLLILREMREFFSLFLDDAKKARESYLEKNWKMVNTLFCGFGPGAEEMKKIGHAVDEESKVENATDESGCRIS